MMLPQLLMMGFSRKKPDKVREEAERAVERLETLTNRLESTTETLEHLIQKLREEDLSVEISEETHGQP
jgi:hypothetical protein